MSSVGPLMRKADSASDIREQPRTGGRNKSKISAAPSILVAVVLLLASCAGCSTWLPEVEPFGAVTSPDHYRSLNGLGVYKKMLQQTGVKVQTPQKLSPRLETIDTIVLVGQSYAPPGRAARRWLEDWLGREEGRTVVYFGRDFSADVYYRNRTLNMLDGSRSERGRRLLAQRSAGELGQRWQTMPENTFCRWFYLDITQPKEDVTQFAGPWAKRLDGAGSWPVSIVLRQPDKGDWQAKKPSWLTTPATGLKPVNQTSTTTSDEALVRRSRWEFNELETDELWDAEYEQLPASTLLLESASGIPLVYQLESDRFPKSKILIAVNGAPMLNGSLVDPLHQQISQQLTDQFLPAKRVALLAYGSQGILISDATEEDQRGAGLQMLMVWPLSAITMPAALLGIIICAAMWPILGRPQSLRRRSVTDFGLHTDALGKMLMESRDVGFAHKAIREYYREVRGEAPPTWVSAAPPARPHAKAVDPAAEPQQASQQLSVNQMHNQGEDGAAHSTQPATARERISPSEAKHRSRGPAGRAAGKNMR